jgi:hypothetical protein
MPFNAPRTVETTEASLLDRMLEEAVIRPSARPLAQPEPVAKATPSILDDMTVTSGGWSRGRRIVMRGDVEIKRQDRDLYCVGGLFGSVDEFDEAQPVANVHGRQIAIPEGATEVNDGESICICGDKGCGIGPFVRTGGSR